ncbi:TPA: DUF6950 family protein [Photobacterium damselae]
MHTETVAKIADYIKENADTPFKWGEFDCCIFISEAIFLQTGLDLYEPYRGKYSTEIGAARAQKKYGTIEHTLDAHFKRVDPMLMCRGDVGMLESGVMFLYFGFNKWAASTEGVSVIDAPVKYVWRVE